MKKACVTVYIDTKYKFRYFKDEKRHIVLFLIHVIFLLNTKRSPYFANELRSKTFNSN